MEAEAILAQAQEALANRAANWDPEGEGERPETEGREL